jgi:hypothetical protein
LDAKSYLIDTVVRGLPVPIIYLRERTDLETLEPQREVVDGQQRLRTLLAFIEPKSLRDYRAERDSFVVLPSQNAEIANKPFPQLSKDARDQIVNYEFSVHVFPPGTDDREVLEIFARLNSTGVRLNPQELRNARFFGELKQLAYSLAYEQLNRWRGWAIFGEMQIARMNEVELVSEFIQLMMYGLRGKTQKSLDDMYRGKDEPERFSEKEEVRRRFRAVLDIIDDTVGSELPKLAFSKVTLFHTLFTYIYDVTYGLGSNLDRRPPRRGPPGLKRCILKASQRMQSEQFSDEVDKALRGRTTHVGSRQIRLDFLRQVCSGASGK